jgi:multicomponent Na+:H+ antiporter subunit D
MVILTVILLPLFTLVFLPLKKISRRLFYSLISLLGITNILILSFIPYHFHRVNLGSNVTFLLDRYSWAFALLVNLAWILTSVYSYSFVKYHFQKSAYKFNAYLSVTLVMVLASAFAGNLFTLFVFYVLSIPLIHPLIILRDIKEAHAAGTFYIKSTLLPASFILLPAIIMIYYFDGHFDFGDQLPTTLSQKPYLASLLLCMFIIGMSKNCVFPFNTWLPRTHLTPSPVIALVNSVAAVNLGSIALIKIAVYVYGFDFLHELTSKFTYAGSLTYFCGFTALYSAYKALKTNNLKIRFSHSTVSQLSYIITAILIATPASILGAMLHILTHSIAKICLFFIAGVYNSIYDTVDISKINKISPHTRLLTLCTALCGFSIAGFPLLAGYFSKDLMLLEELHAGNYAAAIFLLIGSIMNILYIVPLIKTSFLSKKSEKMDVKPIPTTMLISISFCILVLIVLSFQTYTIVRLFQEF